MRREQHAANVLIRRQQHPYRVSGERALAAAMDLGGQLTPFGQFPEALGVYMEMVKSRTGGVNDMTLAVLHDMRAATLD